MTMKLIAVSIFFLASIASGASLSNGSSKNSTITAHSFKVQLTERMRNQSYDKTMAPSYPKRTIVYASLFPRKLRYVDEREETFRVDANLQLNWRDERLALRDLDKESDDNGLLRTVTEEILDCPVVTVDGNEIWIPLLTSPEQTEHIESSFLNQIYTLVDCYGNVQLVGYYLDETSCLLSMRYFPFDQQKCNFTIASRPDVHLRATRLALNDDFYAPHNALNNHDFDCGSWKLFASAYIINRTLNNIIEKVYDYCDNCRNNSRSYMTYKFLLTRHPEQYILDWVVPPVMLGTTGIMTIFLGCDVSERHSFGGTVVVTLTLMLSALREHMAVAYDGYPILAQVYMAFTVTTVVATLFATLPQYVAQRLRDKRVEAFRCITSYQVRNSNVVNPVLSAKPGWNCEEFGKACRRRRSETARNWKRLIALTLIRHGDERHLNVLLMGFFLSVQTVFMAWAVTTWLRRTIY